MATFPSKRREEIFMRMMWSSYEEVLTKKILCIKMLK